MERKIDKKGYTVYAWKKTFDRNEPLDVRVYARAAANVLGIDRLNAAAWDKLLLDTKDLVIQQEKPKAAPKKAKKKSDFWD
jgi:phage terminase large subunit GpA-like protein